MDNFELIEEDKKYLEKYCREHAGAFYSRLIKGMILVNDGYSQKDIENILCININQLNRPIDLYKKYGLRTLLEGDSINNYKIVFDMKNNGWMNLFFDFGNLTIKIELSNVFDPIPDLLQFLNDLNNNKKIINIRIDEEGRFKRIQLNNIDSFNTKLYELTIIADCYPYSQYNFVKVIHKDLFLCKFVDAFNALAKQSINKKWSHYNLSEYILEKIKGIKTI
jgi:hypothetical protein